MISVEQMADILRPWLSRAFVAGHTDLMERITIRLNTFSPLRDDVPDTAQWVDNLLFMAVREYTRGKMVLVTDAGQPVRVRVEDFATMADDALYLLFASLPKDSRSLALIREYSVKHGSLSALKALYLDFNALETQEEWSTVRRVITSCHAVYRWRAWIDR